MTSSHLSQIQRDEVIDKITDEAIQYFHDSQILV